MKYEMYTLAVRVRLFFTVSGLAMANLLSNRKELFVHTGSQQKQAIKFCFVPCFQKRI